MPVTTTDSLSENKGQMCSICKRRVPLARWKDGTGYICPDCDPRESLVTLAPEDAPVERGREVR